MDILISKDNTSPYYKQIVEYVEARIKSGHCSAGEVLPSMNELATALGISKETVKKAYAILRDRGYIEPKQGKGFFICNPEESTSQKVLVLFDKLSAYKQILFNAMAEKIGKNAQVEIRLHNQSVELLQYYLDESLDKFDYYVVTPHFPLDDQTQKAVMKQLKRIPNRKLIMLDHWIKDLPGNYGAVYQDFDHDIYSGLTQGLKDIRKKGGHLNVITLPSSLYHDCISASVKRFCRDNDIEVEFHTLIKPEFVRKNDVYLLLNGQLDSELLNLVREAAAKKLEVGKDYFIISYNESPIHELVLGGLTTVSTDFKAMGQLAAEMILSRSMSKIKCDFKMSRRATF